MTLIDHHKEQQRLTTLYAGMSDAELAELAQDQRSLTEDALRVLESEFSRRGLVFQVQDLSPIPDEKDEKLIILRRYWDTPQGLLAKGLLDSAGIECFLADENTINMNWMWTNGLGGVRLWVREEDSAEAAALLGQESSQIWNPVDPSNDK